MTLKGDQMATNPDSYRYIFHDSPETEITRIEVAQPLAHIETGNELFLTTEDGDSGYSKIAHERVVMSCLKGRVTSDVYVFLEKNP